MSKAGKAVSNFTSGVKSNVQGFLGQFSPTNEGYNSAYDNYQNALSAYNQAIQDNTGESGYNKSLSMAAKGANAVAGGAQQQAQNAYRNAGMSKAQAASLGAGQGSQAYQNNFGEQQANASGQLANETNAKASAAGLQGTAMSSQQQEGQNKYTRMWNNAKNTLGVVGSVLSDGRTKDAVNISASPRECSARFSESLERFGNGKKTYKSLMCKGVK